MIGPWLSQLAVVPTGPVLFVQARRLRRDTIRLPDADQPWRGVSPGDDPIRLLVLGDSTAAGVGASTQAEALPGSLGRSLSTRVGRGVQWRAVGENGATARDLLDRYLDDALSEPFDLLFLSVGANDALGIRSRPSFVRDVRELLAAARRAQPDCLILMSSLPAFHRFELLPNPLRWNLSLHSRNLERGARAVVSQFDDAWMSPPPPPYTHGFFATDSFHPSPAGYRDWARFALDAEPELLSRLAPAAPPDPTPP